MIKNIVLDMGNVLLSFDPYLILNQVIQKKICVFNGVLLTPL